MELIPHLWGLVNLVKAHSLLSLHHRQHMRNSSSQGSLAVVNVADGANVSVRLGAHEVRKGACEDA